MIFWFREVAGWALVALGLVVFLLVYDFCRMERTFDAGIMLVMGIFLFRGGIHLLKVAVAAQAGRQAQEEGGTVLPPSRPLQRSPR